MNRLVTRLPKPPVPEKCSDPEKDGTRGDEELARSRRLRARTTSGTRERVQPIFVGDVQGCGEELGELLERAAAQFGRRFSLWVVGDLVNRGPDNRTPLVRVRELE